MRRAFLAVLAGSILLVPAIAQPSLLPQPAAEIESILDLLDAVDAAQAAVLDAPRPLSDGEMVELRDLVSAAERIGAEDLAAKTRTLLVLASAGRKPPTADLPEVSGSVASAADEPLARDTTTFRRWVNIAATSGATALGMSTIFYILAEQNYRDWLAEPDETLSAQLYRAWQGYDYLQFGLGAATVLTVGVGVPLAFALTPPSTTLATPPEAVEFTPAEREAELQRLYAARAETVMKLNRLTERERRRSRITTISLGAGAAGTIAAATFYYLADQTYEGYLIAASPDDAERLSKQVSLFDLLAVVGAGIGGGGFGFAGTFRAVTPSRSELERELRMLNESIIRVRTSRTIDAPAAQIEPAAADRRSSRRAARADSTPTDPAPETPDTEEGTQ